MGSEVKTMTSSKMLMIALFTFLSLVANTHGESRTIKGKRCIFPFTYKGVTYKTCTKADSELAWCATEVHPSGKVVNNKWEDCDEVVETDLSSIFGPGHEGVVQTAVFRPRQNQTSVDVPAHGQNMALGIVIQAGSSTQQKLKNQNRVSLHHPSIWSLNEYLPKKTPFSYCQIMIPSLVLSLSRTCEVLNSALRAWGGGTRLQLPTSSPSRRRSAS